MRTPVFFLIAGLLATCAAWHVAPPALHAQEAEQRRLVLLVNCQDHGGSALEGVAFSLGREGEDPVTLETDEFGMIRHEFPPAEEEGAAPPLLALTDGRYVAGSTLYSRRRTSRAVTYHHLYTLYHSDPAEMSAAERESYIRALPGILLRERREEGRTDLPATISVFLDGVRSVVEDEENFDPPPAPPDPGDAEDGVEGPYEEQAPAEPEPPGVEVRVLDGLGRPVPGRLVILWTDSEEDGDAHAARRARTGQDGRVRFGGLEAGRVYRPETASQRDGLEARGTIFRAEEDEWSGPVALVLREEGRFLTGFVFDGDEPVAGARLRVVPGNQPELTVVTNEFGFFELSPLQEGVVSLVLRERTGQEWRLPPLRVGRNEVFLPLDLIRVPTAQPSR